ncbi:MAG: peptidase and chymotrypsin/Hap [Frankiales bacterium]|nr:peptidase and chymotrypsin/Hap [Frankiales bacterium]
MTPSRWVLSAACVLAVSGCVAPPTAFETARALATPAAETVGGVLAGGAVDASAREDAVVRASRAVVRVRNRTCDGLATGSGFAVGPHRLVTNRHVVEGARHLTLDTSDGQQLEVEVAAEADDDDLAVITTTEVLPAPLQLAAEEAAPGALVTALGFPLGGPLSRQDGRVIDRVAGARFETPSEVLRSDVHIRPGNSGGPLLDSTGHVVGVVFAVELSGGDALALPVTRLRAVLAQRHLHEVDTTC